MTGRAASLTSSGEPVRADPLALILKNKGPMTFPSDTASFQQVALKGQAIAILPPLR